MLRCALPGADRTFVLCAPATVLRQRKPELSIEELERQQMVLRRLAESSPRCRLIDAAQTPDEVTKAVRAEIYELIQERGK
jgi:hypothetical protein